MRTLRSLPLLFLCFAYCLLSGCAGKNGQFKTPDNEPTLKTLADRTVEVERDSGVMTSEVEAIKAYRNFLDVAPKAPQRAEAMRRIGDLQMDSADMGSDAVGGKNLQPAGDPDFSAAIASYQEFLDAYPNDPGNDRVLYQLARAQEQSGNFAIALQTLDRLVKEYPGTGFHDEAQFRRGELLFTTRNYVMADKAYATVLQSGTAGNYYDRALYMRGWSQFKQGQLDDALKSFFGVLDLKVAGRASDGGLETTFGLSRADRELVEDTFRVVSLSLSDMQGAESIAAYMNSPERSSYEFRVYEQLGELYLKQERVKDAADTFALFARLKPLDAQAPILQARVIEIYEQNGFTARALDAKKEYVVRYGSASEFRQANPQGWNKAQALVKTHVAELARYYHASAQQTKSRGDYQEAIHWYREYLISFPSDPQAAQNNFLLAELLFEDARYAEASIEYEKTAYGYPLHARSADAGYSALLSYVRQQTQADSSSDPDSTSLLVLKKSAVASALHFAKTFSDDSRSAPVLADAAEKLYVLKDSEQAATVAKMVLDRQPEAAIEQRRIAWTVLAYTAFEQGSYEPSEQAFAEVLKLTAADTSNYSDLVERRAAAIYKQGEQARNDNQLSEAVRQFERISSVAPDSAIRATAQYDAAAALMALKNWDSAADMLEDFRRRFPINPLQADVPDKLAAVYLEKGLWARAAAEFESIAVKTKDEKVASDLLWQSAELYQKAGSRDAAAGAYERFVALNTAHLELAIEARYRMSVIAKEESNGPRELALMQAILQADQNGGAARTDRTRYLGATAALALAEPVAEAYRKIALVEPLKKQLKLKKAKMEDALKAYAVATDFGVADISTAATFHIAGMYRDFGKALMTSERPAKLSKLEREQYNVLLEEQAFPFEEKAIEIYEVNAARTASGNYDNWVKRSFDALRELQPVRYGKTERVEEISQTVKNDVNSAARQAASLNQLGVNLRQQGQFQKAADAYQQAIVLDANYTFAILNQGILYDMYLGDNKRALDLYGHYLALRPDGDPDVSKWITELKNRIKKEPNPLAATHEINP